MHSRPNFHSSLLLHSTTDNLLPTIRQIDQLQSLSFFDLIIEIQFSRWLGSLKLLTKFSLNIRLRLLNRVAFSGGFKGNWKYPPFVYSVLPSRLNILSRQEANIWRDKILRDCLLFYEMGHVKLFLFSVVTVTRKLKVFPFLHLFFKSPWSSC